MCAEMEGQKRRKRGCVRRDCVGFGGDCTMRLRDTGGM